MANDTRKKEEEEIADFWSWFVSNAKGLEAWSKTPSILDDLKNQLDKIDGRLTFELGRPDGLSPWDFILSADGDREVFGVVEAVWNKRPEVSGWKIMKFRQRKPDGLGVKINGVGLAYADLRYTLGKKDRNGKMDLCLFFPGYTKSEHEKYFQAASLLLDGLLGEFDVETGIGAVNCVSTGNAKFRLGRPMSELPKEFDARANV